jgi:hypothetical protein
MNNQRVRYRQLLGVLAGVSLLILGVNILGSPDLAAYGQTSAHSRYPGYPGWSGYPSYPGWNSYPSYPGWHGYGGYGGFSSQRRTGERRTAPKGLIYPNGMKRLQDTEAVSPKTGTSAPVGE